MASILKLPRLQLLALMLFLVAGLFPEKSLADEEPAPASASDAAEGVAPADASGGSPNGTVEGRADVAAVECYRQKFCSGKKAECLVALNTLEKDQCKTGHCYGLVRESQDEDVVNVERRCGLGSEVACKKAKCSFYDSKMTSQLDKSLWGQTDPEYTKCVKEYNNATHVEGREDKKDEFKGKIAICMCNTALCNNQMSSAPTGVKQLGDNVAFLGALLVVLFYLRTMF